MLDLLSNVAIYTVTFTMIMACGVLVAKPRHVANALAEHRAWPAGWRSAIAVTHGGVQLAVGGWAAGVMFSGQSSITWMFLVVAAALLAGYAAYSLFLTRRMPGVPCGCLGSHQPVNQWVVLRATALAAVSAAASLAADRTRSLLEPSIELAVILPASATFALLTWVLPEALANPTQTNVSPDVTPLR